MAWGAVPTDRPVRGGAGRYWRALADLWCRLVDMAELEPEQLAADAPPESLVDLAGEVELAMQVLDMAYRRLSIAYFNAVGPDDPPGLDTARSRQ